jgi:hypothetical protein
MSANLATPALSFVGRYTVGDTPHLLPIGAREADRAQEFFARVLREEGIARGRKALVIATLGEAASIIPFERAAIDQGLIMCNTEDSPYDGARTEATIRRFDIALVAPVSGTAVDAIAAAGFFAGELFRGKTVWARPDAYARLQTIPGIDLRRWLEIGPVTALETKNGGGLLYDGREWLLEPDGKVTYVTSRLDRAQSFTRLRVPVEIRLNLHEYSAALPGPRVVLA